MNGDALGDTVPCRILGGGGNREWINVDARAVRCTKGDRRQQKNAAPGSNIEDAWPVAGERLEVTGGAPLFKADECEPRGGMEPRAERLAWVNRDNGIARGGVVFTPRGANNNATDAQDGELGAPTGCPLFGGDRSYEEWSDTAQANATTGERREAL